ncbi:MAG: hypothetical protein JWQ27_2230 [Ferruginibacter sp.]|nr:hypothetical protein [Ferruginibacter sp.]
MDLRATILQEHSKAQCRKIVHWVADAQQRFDELFQLFLQDEYRVVQRAAWPLSICVENHPQLFSDKFDALIKKMKEPAVHPSVKRNGLRLLLFVTIPKKQHGTLMDFSFNMLEDPKEPVAVKVFALYLLGKFAKGYPEIIPEIKLFLDDLEDQSAGLRSCAGKLRAGFK